MEAVAKKPTRKEKIASGTPKPLQKVQRKKVVAEKRKEERKTQYFAKLRDYPSSPRKMRYMADAIRGKDVAHALAILKLIPNAAARPLRTLLRAAMDSFEQKSGQRYDAVPLFVKTVMVDSATQLKRLRTAPQGRAHRIRKRSNHVTIHLGIRENASK